MNRVLDITDKAKVIFEATNEILNEWKTSRQDESCFKIPDMVAQLAVKCNWDEKQVRENDALVRFFLRHNEDWVVTRGAKGGARPAEAHQARQAASAAKDALKAQLKAKIEGSPTSDESSENESTDE